ncbi:MAG TPA: serine/threonine-protein kinase [Streptosporangiaceae bacterium]|nr:serine/threonine-protein kinase [Streptosporangiaceae bacterium]
MTEGIYPSLSPGAEIAGYRIESLLGRGGMAVVFKARDLRLDRPVGLKVLAPELSESPQFRERFLRESRLAASLDHPNIIPVYEAGEEHGLLFIAMRLVGGGDLAERLRHAGRLSPADTVGIVAQVAAALDAAHAAGLVHRDVKPGNILVVPGVAGQHRDHVYLSDFGLTKRVTSLSGVTAQGQFIATMDYAAPEQIGSRPVDARTDVYGLGCVAYQCLTGSVPFVRDNEAALLWAHLVERPPPVSAHQVGLAPFDAAVARALEKNPEDRFDSCGQFVDALAAALPTPAAAPPTPHRTPPPAAPDVPAQAAAGQDTPTQAAAGPDTLTGIRAGKAAPPAPAPPPPPAPVNAPPVHAVPPPPPPPADAAGMAGSSASSAVPTPPVAPPTEQPEQPEQRLDRDVPDLARPPAGAGGPQPARRRFPRWAVLVAALVVLAVPIFFLVAAFTGGSGASGTSNVAAATRQCQGALTAADQTLANGQEVARQVRVHAGLMNQMQPSNGYMPQMKTMGRASLTAGALASGKYDDALANYQPLSAGCLSNTASPQVCKARVTAANDMFGHASNLVTDLKQHTAVMDAWDSGQLTADQAHDQGMPSLDAGVAEATALDQSVGQYQAAGKC